VVGGWGHAAHVLHLTQRSPTPPDTPGEGARTGPAPLSLEWSQQTVSPGSMMRAGVMDASPLAEVYDETVGQLLEVLAEKDRLQGRVKMLEREMRCKDEQLQLFARWACALVP